ncbi:protein TBATA [Amia ocellicauda]|uniref:protein TBATA n=1 Tax=Amia ocellicauda TaxID=2972642 RepID=UPI003463FAB6
MDQKPEAMEASVKKRMEILEDAVSTAINRKDALKNMKKVEDVSFNNPLRLTEDAGKLPAKGSPRFGTLSHHSFFSRHNPHPNRVTHIQGLNGNPVCIVNDDWYATSPSSPHPFLRDQTLMTVLGAPGVKMPYGELYGNQPQKQGTALLSDAWREELKDLAAKVCLSAPLGTDGKKTNHQAEEGAVRRSTQYSARTGRIIPSSSLPSSRRSSGKHSRTGGQATSSALYDQELMVLELLCQILQTDSLSQVQQWLLLAGQREKDLVMGMIQQAVDRSTFDRPIPDNPEGLHTLMSPLARNSVRHSMTKDRLPRSYQGQKQEAIKEEMPERMGTAEVLLIHTDETLQIPENEVPDDCSN